MADDVAHTTILTGVSRGFGREAAQLLIRQRPRDDYVVLARTDAGQLIEALTDSTGCTRVTGLACDLASLADMRQAARWIGAELDAGRLAPLGGYLGNAGLVVPTANTRSTDGYETTFAVNVLAHYLLVRLLMDRFVAPTRIVLTSSDTHFGQFRYTLAATPPPRWEAPKRLAAPRAGDWQAGSRAYATSKLALIYLTHAFARRLPPGVDVFSYNPALVAGTGLFRATPQPLRSLLNGFFRLQLAAGRGMTPKQAGARLADTLLAPAPGPSGSYLDRGQVVPSSPESYDEDREEQLWLEAGHLVGFAASPTSSSAVAG